MSDQSSGASSGQGPNLGDLFTMFGGGNPLKTFDQFRGGIADFLATVQKLSGAVDDFRALTTRIHGLLDVVEEPMRAVAPGMTNLASTLSSPELSALPARLDEFFTLVGDIAARMGPLMKVAEVAGGMFGIATSSPSASPAPAPVLQPPAASATASPAKKAPAKKATAKKATAKKTTAKKTTAKKTTAKKTATKRATAKKAPCQVGACHAIARLTERLGGFRHRRATPEPSITIVGRSLDGGRG